MAFDAALFPVTLQATTPEGRRMARQAWCESQWATALDTLVFEGTIVLIAGRQIATGSLLSDVDEQRLAEAVQRLTDARQVLRGH